MISGKQSQKQQFMQDIATYNMLIESKFGDKIVAVKLPGRSEYNLLFRGRYLTTCYNQVEVNKFVRAFAEFSQAC